MNHLLSELKILYVDVRMRRLVVKVPIDHVLARLSYTTFKLYCVSALVIFPRTLIATRVPGCFITRVPRFLASLLWRRFFIDINPNAFTFGPMPCKGLMSYFTLGDI